MCDHSPHGLKSNCLYSCGSFSSPTPGHDPDSEIEANRAISLYFDPRQGRQGVRRRKDLPTEQAGLAILMRDHLRRGLRTLQVDREANSIQASRFLLGGSRVIIPLLASSALGLCARRLV